MATAATIKKNIAKLEAALKSKATPKSLKSKLEAQLVKSKAELSGINKGTKPKTSSTKSTQTALQKLKEMVNKNKKLKTYKKSGVDLEKDADRPAKPIGKRTAKSGNTYYEYRANRIDVKQPPKRYPKLEKGGYMAKGGKAKTSEEKQIEKAEKSLEYFKKEAAGGNEYAKKNIANLEEYIKELKENKYAEGGEVDRERMYNFLKEDLAELENAIEENNQEEIEKFFSYWNIHLKSLKPKTGSKRMYEFFKDDLVGLEAATKELPSSKEETDRFFSYWNTHLNSLDMKGGELKVREDFKYQNTAKRWLDDHDGTSLAYKVAVLLLKGDNNPDETLNIDYERYNRVLRSLDSISESKHEMAWRTENYSQAEAQNWAKETVSNIFELNDTDKMAKGGVSEKPIPAIMDKYGNVKSLKLLEQELEYLKEAYEDKLVTKDEYEKSYNEIKEQIKLLQSKEKGGYFAKGGYVAVSETKDGYWVVISRPTTKESAEEMADSLREDNRKVLNEETKVVTLEEAKAHKKIIGKEYLEKGGYMAKGGALEHGLMVGDTVRDIAENSVAIYNVNNRKSYVVDLDKGTRTEWIGSFKDRRKYAEKGAYMELGGEMHRTQE